MDSLELSLEILVDLHSFTHLFVNHVLIRNCQGNEEASGVSFTLQVGKSGQHPVQHVVEGLLVTVDDLSTEIRVEICRVAQNFEEAANTLFSLILSFLLHIDTFMGLVEVLEDSVDKFEQFEWRFVVELHH